MMRHDLRNGQVFPDFNGSWALNKENENALQFSRMDEWQNYQWANGKYVLRYEM